ncbi:transcriptional regulator MraZ [Allofranklinella schreckenbergeri]|uniref:Transcriptional regulator MraZ n=1 Tax=Allofranklinella schreckenbergeri TaxID=1076744 RepID=A0A3M6QG09_9BURK|nr:division/cell wall cluster transcriptional repressor MraZ [Allofranklinella schreckenbergeri]RMX02023.1 transcriptional regulator MraZ [Allofranklinella schreckenbergeri]
MLFQGISSVTIDAKGRLSVPTRYRDVLVGQFEGRVTLTRSPDGCLMLFPRPDWERYRTKVLDLPESAKWFKRILVGSALDTDIDATGRLLVAPELREAAKLTKGALLLGMGSYFELWDKAIYEEKEAAAMAEGMPDALKDFTF